MLIEYAHQSLRSFVEEVALEHTFCDVSRVKSAPFTHYRRYPSRPTRRRWSIPRIFNPGLHLYPYRASKDRWYDGITGRFALSDFIRWISMITLRAVIGIIAAIIPPRSCHKSISCHEVWLFKLAEIPERIDHSCRYGGRCAGIRNSSTSWGDSHDALNSLPGTYKVHTRYIQGVQEMSRMTDSAVNSTSI